MHFSRSLSWLSSSHLQHNKEGDLVSLTSGSTLFYWTTTYQWIVIDSKVYDLSKFASLHPGGANVLYAHSIGAVNTVPTACCTKSIIIILAGKDATQAFFGLHRHEVLLKPQYKRLQIGTVLGQSEQIRPPVPGELSKVPYAEPTWLSPGYYSPYYSNSHRTFQTAVREFFETVVRPESDKCEASGKRISQEVVDKMASVDVL